MNNKKILNEFQKYPFLNRFEKTYDFDPDGSYDQIYVSEKINNEVLKSFNDIKSVKKTIEKMMKSGKLKIGYADDRVFSFFKNKFLYFFGMKNYYTLGYFSTKKNVIYVLLDDNINIFGNEIFDIKNTVIHELIHMSAANDPVNFYKTNVEIFKKFYKEFFLNIIYFNVFNGPLIDLKKSEIKSYLNSISFDKCIEKYVLRNLMSVESLKSGYLNIKKSNNSLFQTISEIYENILFIKLEDYNLKSIKKAINNKINLDGNYAINVDSQIKDIIKLSYKNCGINSLNSVVKQEMIYVSEIISVLYQYRPKHKNVYKTLILLNKGI